MIFGKQKFDVKQLKKNKFISDIKQLKMKKYTSDVKQLKMNKFIKSTWQLNISTSKGTLKVPSLRPYMDGVDKNDALLGNCSSCRKALKWKTKIAVHMTEEAILNAFILYNKPGRSMGLLKFKLQFIRST